MCHIIFSMVQVRMGLDVCFAQLLGTGVVHADPHYGNMLYDEVSRAGRRAGGVGGVDGSPVRSRQRRGDRRGRCGRL